MTTRRGRALGAVGVWFTLCWSAASAGPAPLHRAVPLRAQPAALGRLIVKYRPQVSACAHCLLAQGIPFATVTGSDSLDRLHQRLGVRGAHALFFDQHGSSADRSAAYFNRLAEARARFAGRTARAAQALTAPDLSNVFVVDLPRGVDVEAAAALYAADPNVEYAHPDYELTVMLMPNDPFFSSLGTWGQPYADLWGLHLTDAATAWDTARGTGTVVAVVDTGVDYTHADLAANLWANPAEIPNNGVDDDNNGFVDDVIGWDFVDGTNDPMDRFGHGTHVAGTVAAVGNNGVGVVGMAWGARVMAVRGLNERGVGYDSTLAPAIVYAAENGADVLNNSWGGFSFNLATGAASVVRDAVDTALSLGVVVVASAGNEGGSVDYVEPAGYPGVIATGATDHTDSRASFSNYGTALSVAAPGVDILSLRSAISPIDPFGQVVASRYIRLNGTSMAAPHVAGLSAVLLSAVPGLTPDEVRWHLELNADQPGYTGYEGQPWNPFFGYGRINAARVFDLPPVTTRLHGRADLHAYVDSVIPDVAAADFLFTTRNPVAWSLSSPSWLPASLTTGSGPAHLSFSADSTGLAVGPYAGDVVLDAPAAVDGGGRFSATLQTHRDPRSGGRITITNAYVANSVPPGPVPAASDGSGALVVWDQWTALPTQLYAARVDGAGNLDGPTLIHTNTETAYHEIPAIAFDGRNYLVAWDNYEEISSFRTYKFRNSIMAMRVTASGTPLDGAPIVLMSHTDRGNSYIGGLGVGFDGAAYTVVWNQSSLSNGRGKVYAWQIGADGTLRGRPHKLYPQRAFGLGSGRGSIVPHIACASRHCLLIWGVRSGALSPAGFYLDDIYGIRLAGTAIVDPSPIPLLSGINLGLGDPQVTTNGTDFLVLAGRVVECGGTLCGQDFVATRVSSAAAVLDPGGIVLNASPLQDASRRALTSDGTGYLVSFVGGGSRAGTQVFALRLASDGQVVESEVPGALVLPDSLGKVPAAYGSSMAPVITGTATGAMLTWVDTLNFDPSSGYVTWTNPISAQRVFAHAPSGVTTLQIGNIGPRTVAERDTLTFFLTAPTLNGATTIVSGTNLPPGAILDPTGFFRWTPAGDQTGVYPGVHFEATDGTQTVGEDVTITVTEASLSIGGTVTNSDTTPAAGIAVKLSGVRLTVHTDAAGRFRFEGLVPGSYAVRLDRPSSRQYLATPATTRVTLASSDRGGVNMVLTPK
jgi:subtilisin family serine protease